MRIRNSDGIFMAPLPRRFRVISVGNYQLAYDLQSRTDEHLYLHAKMRFNKREYIQSHSLIKPDMVCPVCGTPISHKEIEHFFDSQFNLRVGSNNVLYPFCVLCATPTGLLEEKTI